MFAVPTSPRSPRHKLGSVADMPTSAQGSVWDVQTDRQASCAGDIGVLHCLSSTEVPEAALLSSLSAAARANTHQEHTATAQAGTELPSAIPGHTSLGHELEKQRPP